MSYARTDNNNNNNNNNNNIFNKTTVLNNRSYSKALYNVGQHKMHVKT